MRLKREPLSLLCQITDPRQKFTRVRLSVAAVAVDQCAVLEDGAKDSRQKVYPSY